MNYKKTLLNLAITLTACLAASIVFADDDPVKPTTLAELKTAIIAVMQENEVPAVGIAMVNKDGAVWVEALGKANLENDIDADKDSMFRIGSTSKMFVALSILKLVEEGKLSLDDRVADLVPDLKFTNQWEATDPVRVVHLLEHTTGWDNIHLPEYAHNDPTPVTLEAGLAFHPHSRVSRWKPGSRMSYCNAGPPVAALIVQSITGQDFEAYVKENFFDPMGMETMTYLQSDDVKTHGVTSYNNGNQAQDYWHIIMRPSGSINASVIDMARFISFYVNGGSVDGQQLISPESLQRMETTVSTSGAMAGQKAGYGLNNYSSPYEQWEFRSHNGGVNGGLTELAYLPEAGLGHVIMINSGDGSAFREISKLVRGFETRELAEIEITRERDVSAQNRGIAGYYYEINPRQQIAYFLERILNVTKLWFEEDKLARKGLFDDETNYYFPVSDQLYKSEKNGLVSLSQTTDPIAGTVVHMGTTVLKPTGPVLVYSQLGIAALWILFMVTSGLFFPVWLIRKLRGKISAGASIRIRTWPLLASVSIAAFVGLFMVGGNDPFKQLGAPTLVSVGIMLITLAFALFAVLGVYTAIKERQTVMNKGTYWHSSIASLLNLVVAVYLLSFGAIGLMTWV